MVPRNNDINISTILDIQSGLFIESFTFSILALWLLASGVPVFNPVRREFYDAARNKPLAIAASILCWTGVALLIAIFIINITVSPSEVHSSQMHRACYMRICGRI